MCPWEPTSTATGRRGTNTAHTDGGEALEPGSSAAMILFEHTWANGFRDALVDAGGELIDSLRIPPKLVEAARDDCAWTLFDESGQRARAELCGGLHVEPPPDYPNDWDVLGWTMIFGSIVAGIASLGTRLP